MFSAGRDISPVQFTPRLPLVENDPPHTPLPNVDPQMILDHWGETVIPWGPASLWTQQQLTINSLPIAIHPSHQTIATELKTLFDDIKLAEAYEKIPLLACDGHTLYEVDSKQASQIFRWVQGNSELSPQQKLALRFFVLGESLNREEINVVFKNHPQLFQQLSKLQLLKGDKEYARLNNVTVWAHRLPNGKSLYAFADLPIQNVDSRQEQPTAQIAGTSLRLLERIEEDQRRGKTHSGLVTDFGSGTGIQALALLVMHSGIEMVYGLDIDEHSLNLSRWNAMLNEVGERFQALDNHDLQNLARTLNGRKLSFAVSNPPYNVVPEKYSKEFTDFGDGGPHGIAVTQIFLDQALPLLNGGAEFILYSQLARSDETENHPFFLSQAIFADHLSEVATITYEKIDDDNNDGLSGSRENYARGLSLYLQQHAKNNAVQDDLQHNISAVLAQDHVYSLEPTYIRIQKKDDQPLNPFQAFALDINEENFKNSGEKIGCDTLTEEKRNPGGIYITTYEDPSSPKRNIFAQTIQLFERIKLTIPFGR